MPRYWINIIININDSSKCERLRCNDIMYPVRLDRWRGIHVCACCAHNGYSFVSTFRIFQIETRNKKKHVQIMMNEIKVKIQKKQSEKKLERMGRWFFRQNPIPSLSLLWTLSHNCVMSATRLYTVRSYISARPFQATEAFFWTFAVNLTIFCDCRRKPLKCSTI